jgi:hypothetical protein
MKIVRGFFGVVAGLIASWLPVMAAETIAHRLFPPPQGTDMADMAKVKLYVASLPMAAFLLVLLGWAIATLIGTSVGARIGRHPACGYIVGAMLLAAGVANAVMIPQPLWFSAVSFLLFIGLTFVGVALTQLRAERDLSAGSSGYNPPA